MVKCLPVVTVCSGLLCLLQAEKLAPFPRLSVLFFYVVCVKVRGLLVEGSSVLSGAMTAP